jgi:hypothetical protein
MALWGAATAVAIGLLLFLSSRARTERGQWTYENPAMGALFFLGIVQVVWVIPLGLSFLIPGRTRTFAGILIAAGILFLLNAGLLLLLAAGR